MDRDDNPTPRDRTGRVERPREEAILRTPGSPNVSYGREPPTPFLRKEYEIATAVVMRSGFDQEEISDILQVLASKGGCCDCEILHNVAEEKRLKAKYWKERAGGLSSEAPGHHLEA